MSEIPGEIVTFLCTDIERSTRLWEHYPDDMGRALARHDAVVRDTVKLHDGSVDKTTGDGFYTRFASPLSALHAALAIQRTLQTEPWHETVPLRVRMALHTGPAEWRSGYYVCPSLNRATRLLVAGHGGQLLLSLTTAEQVRDHLPAGVELHDLGQHRLKDLQRPEQVFQVVAPDLRADFPPLRSLEAFQHNLPVQRDSFIGREREIAEVKRLLVSARLLTLTGPAGAGKTRLALQIAADLVDEIADGVWLADLARLSDPALLPQTLAATFGVVEEVGRPLLETLANALRRRTLLLLLDNCEHLIEASARTTEALLRACPTLRLLATSREAFGIAGETTWSVPPLSLPDSTRNDPEAARESEAVRLFIERATQANPDFRSTVENLPSVVQICQRLDGIPLALELAAARVKDLTIEQLAAGLDDRFRLLTGGDRTALPRQQTLQAAIEWSYNQLSPSEKTLFRRFSVFAGGWSLEAAEAVGGDAEIPGMESVGILLQLVDKSLVVFEEQGESSRYRLLESLRAFGRDRLLESGESEAVRARHLTFFLHLAEDAEPHQQGPDPAKWFELLERELNNLRAAMEWSQATRRAEDGLRLAGALWRFWYMRGYHSEGWERTEALLLLAGANASASVRAKALTGAGHLARLQNRLEEAEQRFLQSLALREQSAEERGIAETLNGLGILARDRKDYASAHDYYARSQALYHKLGDIGRSATLLGNIGGLAIERGDYEAARPLLEESLAILRRVGSTLSVANALHNLGDVTYKSGDFPAADLYLREGLSIAWEAGDRNETSFSLQSLGMIAHYRGDSERAACLLGAAQSAQEAGNLSLSDADREDFARDVATVRAALSEVDFDACWAAGRAMSSERAVVYALTE